MENLKILAEELISRAVNAKLRPDIPESWKRLAAEAMLEIEKD